ncbi:MAG: PilZ domain-containing protein [Candidatus Firestonebacteria bacterium]|nr:PilZ domain-containing protein [Candidatus Firestonebacteria bacterium]
MSVQRLNKRVAVELPIVCKLEKQEQLLEMQGRVNDLSINGMKISFSRPLHAITSKLVDFVLELPHPFSRIKGHGEIQWKRWNADKQCTTCGVKLAPMNINHLSELDAIISEIQED